MKKYTLTFGTDFRKKNKLESCEIHQYYDIKDNKTLGDIKDFITCFNNSICTCMLKLYTNNKQISEENDDDNKKLKEISKDGMIYIGQIEQKCKCNFLINNESLISLSKRSYIKKINDLEKISEIEEKQQQDFYDVIININSILDINNGWKIEMSSRGEQKYKTFKGREFIKIGVVGNINKGKSFILSKLSRINLPTGTSINTKGLSIKYPDLELGNDKRKFILLDSAGFEKPILKSKIIKEKSKENDNKINEENKNEIKEENGIEEDEYYQAFISRARDILITESFLQSFIISESDLLLIVLDTLSISEQKLINKIKREIKIKKISKKIFIIHNLKTFRTVQQVEAYVNEILLKSVSFHLRKESQITSDKSKHSLGYYFTEIDQKI